MDLETCVFLCQSLFEIDDWSVVLSTHGSGNLFGVHECCHLRGHGVRLAAIDQQHLVGRACIDEVFDEFPYSIAVPREGVQY